MYEIEEIVPPFPDSIFVKIFGSLPLNDRRNVRLTCKRWRELCNQGEITQREKFVFRSHYQDKMELLEKSIVNCTTFRVKFEFEGLCIWKLSPDVWRHLGSDVKDIRFMDCLLDERVLLDILIHCPRAGLGFRASAYYDVIRSGNALGNLIKREVLAKRHKPSLKSMIRQVGKKADPQIWSGLMNWCSWKIRTAVERDLIIFPSTYEQYVGASWLVGYCKPEAKDRFHGTGSRGLMTRKDFQIYNDYFSNQSHLRTLKLNMAAYPSRDGDVKEFLSTILTTLPHLECLEFSFKLSWVKFTFEEFEKFLEQITHLKTLKLKLGKFKLANFWKLHSTAFPMKYTPCRNLTLLDMKFGNRNLSCERMQVEILRRCPNLEELSLQNATDYVLKHIMCKKQLRVLYIDCDDHGECSIAGFYFPDPNNPDSVYSLHQLPNLKKLEIILPREIGTLVKETIFPKIAILIMK